MKISTILDHIDSRLMARPEFQRGCAWNRDQVRALFVLIYRLKYLRENDTGWPAGPAELA